MSVRYRLVQSNTCAFCGRVTEAMLDYTYSTCAPPLRYDLVRCVPGRTDEILATGLRKEAADNILGALEAGLRRA